MIRIVQTRRTNNRRKHYKLDNLFQLKALFWYKLDRKSVKSKKIMQKDINFYLIKIWLQLNLGMGLSSVVN